MQISALNSAGIKLAENEWQQCTEQCCSSWELMAEAVHLPIYWARVDGALSSGLDAKTLQDAL